MQTNIAILEHTKGLGTTFMLEDIIQKWQQNFKIASVGNPYLKGCDVYFSESLSAMDNLLELQKMNFEGIVIWYRPFFKPRFRSEFVDIVSKLPFSNVFVLNRNEWNSEMMELCESSVVYRVLPFEEQNHAMNIQPFDVFNKFEVAEESEKIFSLNA